MEIPMRCVKNEARSNVWEVPAEGAPALNATRNGKPYGIQPQREQEKPRRIKLEEPRLCLWVWCKDRGKTEVISGEVWCILLRKAFLWFWGTEEKVFLYVPSCLSFGTLLIPFFPSLLANTASICDLVWVLFQFLILYSYMILDFTSTSSSRVWRFSQEFWSYFFHIIFIITSEIHSLCTKSDDIATFLQAKTTERGVSLTHRISIYFLIWTPQIPEGFFFCISLTVLEAPGEITVVPLC